MTPLGIGERLRSARLARGLSLDDVEAGTRIRRRFLEALEREEFDELPGPVYVRGFLRIYGEFLGIPAEELLAQCPGSTAPRTLRGTPVDVRITPVMPRSQDERDPRGAAAGPGAGHDGRDAPLPGPPRRLGDRARPGSGRRAGGVHPLRADPRVRDDAPPRGGAASGRRGVQDATPEDAPAAAERGRRAPRSVLPVPPDPEPGRPRASLHGADAGDGGRARALEPHPSRRGGHRPLVGPDRRRRDDGLRGIPERRRPPDVGG